jgi:hypothetical protein
MIEGGTTVNRSAVALLLALPILAACAASPSPEAAVSTTPATTSAAAEPSGEPTPTESSAPPEPRTIATAEDVVAATGCTGYALADTSAPFAATYGTCQWSGGRLQVYTFASEGDMASFFETVASFGVTPEQTAVVGLVVAAPESPRDLAELRAALA